ncbi:uncharacterized protein LOC126249740 [Schistocerca nitens]|uniref:uncharacterized protein LOC126249740 n=1 Tax=Schistocerca nitens TaxID=7011 RepID=UPI002118A57E|nr:uncharacterized protein LOC126249740 [Schistocerca nitens]
MGKKSKFTLHLVKQADNGSYCIKSPEEDSSQVPPCPVPKERVDYKMKIMRKKKPIQRRIPLLSLKVFSNTAPRMISPVAVVMRTIQIKTKMTIAVTTARKTMTKFMRD